MGDDASPKHKDKDRKHKHKDKDKDREKDKDRKERKKVSKHKDHKKDKVREEKDRKEDREKEQDASKVKIENDIIDDRKRSDKDRSKDEERKRKETTDKYSSPDEGEVSDAPSPSGKNRVDTDQTGVGASSGGELSLSIEETNRLRVSLGLKPLKTSNEPSKKEMEARAQREEERKAAEAEALAAKIKQQREHRLQQEKLDKTKLLGEQDEDVGDDLSAWVRKTRTLEEKQKAEERAKAAKLARALDEQDDVADESEEEDEYGNKMTHTGRDLAGLKVKEGVEELMEGETVIMTLDDKPILDEKGELNEEDDILVNTRAKEEAQRAKARRAANKTAKPLWEEDGKVRGLLDKYDDEEEAAAMEINADGSVEIERRRRQAEITKKLALESAIVDDADLTKQVASEYFTQEEMSTMFKPKKKKKKVKERKIRKKDLADTIEALEAEVEVAEGGGDLGSRTERTARAAREAAATAKEIEDKRQRYERALEKANYATLAGQVGADADDDDDVAAEEDELYESLARARRAVEKSTTTANGGADIVQEVAAKRREEEEQKAKEVATGGLAFTSTSEFVRSVAVAAVDDRAGGGDEGEVDDMDVEEEAAVAPLKKTNSKSDRRGGRGNWVSADVDEMMEDGGPQDDGAPSMGATDADAGSGTFLRERNVGKGLAGALQVLRERGELKGGLEKVEWSGRTNDMRKDKLVGLDEVYGGGHQEDRMDRDLETALTRRDELGRVMTPKEAFRHLSYKFHGKAPSKNKEEKRQRKQAEDLAKKRQATTEASSSSADVLRQVQQVTKTPYVVLSGQIKAGQISDPSSGYATVDKAASLSTPYLGGGATPLVGDRKVEAMLGVRKKGDGSMPPPPPKRPKA